ncbi:MAG: hypothetical protein JWR23_2385 [Mucilaginibacter sp.]|nr:hypothetical protein [Mucilaginibacter sp.]
MFLQKCLPLYWSVFLPLNIKQKPGTDDHRYEDTLSILQTPHKHKRPEYGAFVFYIKSLIFLLFNIRAGKQVYYIISSANG